MLRTWLELGPRYIEVSFADPRLIGLMDLIPLVGMSDEPPGETWAAMTIHEWTAQDRRDLPDEISTSGCRQSALPNQSGSGPDATVWLCEDRIAIILPGHGYALCDTDWAHSQIHVTADSDLNGGMVVGCVVQAIAAHHGYFGVHASIVERAGVGVMFCGAPGQGKSSSCLALGRAGWTVRADDRCYLHRKAEGLLIWGPGGEMRLRADAPKLWHDVAEVMARGVPWGAKTRVRLHDIVSAAGPGDVRPAALFFPQIAGGQHRVEPLAPDIALPQLLRVSGLSSLPLQAAAHFEIAADLVETTPCYRLLLGPDMSLLPAFIAETVG